MKKGHDGHHGYVSDVAPIRGRGLKFGSNCVLQVGDASPPYVGAWIEMAALVVVSIGLQSPPKRCVD